MLHKVYDIELPYEKLGLKTPDKKATITTYIKEMYPDYQDSFNRPLVIICPVAAMTIIRQERARQ